MAEAATTINTLTLAQEYASYGLSVIPVCLDGSKKPAISWKDHQAKSANDEQLQEWFANNDWGVGIVCGDVSGGLEVIDFDDPDLFEPWGTAIQTADESLFDGLVIVKTPGGYHILYRCPGAIQGNLKLAEHKSGAGRNETDIETRGEGGYIVAPGNPLAAHPYNKPYTLYQGTLENIPTITPDERELLINSARMFNAVAPDAKTYPEPSTYEGGSLRPGDDYGAKVSWEELLEPSGWTKLGEFRSVTHWRRPGKDKGGNSATTGYGKDKLYVFSSNASPFEPQTSYSKFAAYTLLNHNGDYKAAAKTLRAQGYGDGTDVQETHDFADPDNWEEILPFSDVECPPISADVLPGWLGEYVSAVARSTQTPPEMSVMMALGVLSTCLQKKIEVSPWTGYQEPVNLWCVAVMPSGSRKSAVMAAFTKPLHEFESEQAETMRAQIIQNKNERSVIEKQINKNKEEAAKAKSSDDTNRLIQQATDLELQMPKELKEPKLWVGDATPEQVQNLLADHDEKMAWLSSEGGIFDIAAGLYSNGRTNYDVFTQAFSGDPVRVQRGSRYVDLKRPALTMGLAIQPQVLHEMGHGSKKGFRGKGLLGRFLYAFPKSNVGRRDVRLRASVADDLINKYNAGIRQLLDMSVDSTPVILRLDIDALAIYDALAASIEADHGEGRKHEDITDWTSRLPTAALKIAALIHAVKHGHLRNNIIDAETMETAVEICETLIPHAQKALGITQVQQKFDDAHYVQEWITKNYKNNSGSLYFAEMELKKATSRFNRSEPERFTAAMQLLEAHHVISKPQKLPTRKPTRIRYIHPELSKGCG